MSVGSGSRPFSRPLVDPGRLIEKKKFLYTNIHFFLTYPNKLKRQEKKDPSFLFPIIIGPLIHNKFVYISKKEKYSSSFFLV